MDFPGVSVGILSQCRRCLQCKKCRETQVQSLGWEDPLVEKIAIYSYILAWRIPWIEKAGGLRSIGSQGVGHDLATEHEHLYIR